MAELRVGFRLPVPGRPRAEVVSDYGLHEATMTVDGRALLSTSSPGELRAGITAPLPGTGHLLTLRAADATSVELLLDGTPVSREDRTRAPTSRSAWIHGGIALGGSAFGLAASVLYLRRAQQMTDAWALKMAMHMAAWHLILALTLFPASVWGQRTGIRLVQGASAVFFAIHLGIALANAGSVAAQGLAIAVLNAASGACFLAAVLQGQTAHRDMDPFPGDPEGPHPSTPAATDVPLGAGARRGAEGSACATRGSPSPSSATVERCLALRERAPLAALAPRSGAASPRRRKAGPASPPPPGPAGSARRRGRP